MSLPTNLELAAAYWACYLYAAENNYDIAVQMDGDGQHDPNYLMDLITPVANGEADMVTGSRFIKNEGFQTSGCAGWESVS